MNYSSTLDSLQEYLKKIITIGKEYLTESNFKDFIIISEAAENIELIVGLDRLSIFSFFDIGHHRIYLKTCYWSFDPSVIGNWKKILLEEFDVLITHDYIKLWGFKDKFYNTPESIKNFFSAYLSKIREHIFFIHQNESEKMEERIIKSNTENNI